MSCKPRHLNKFISLATVSLGGALSFGGFTIYKGDEDVYKNIIMPFCARFIDPEIAHEICIYLTKHKLIRCQDRLNWEQRNKLQVNIFDRSFSNPIGLAAGFDKNSKALVGLPHYGFGFAEVGTVTPKPQDGNPKKRIFRLVDTRALINRCGFNNDGIDEVTNRLKNIGKLNSMIVGLNLGKNKDSQHLSNDYLIGLEKSKDLELVDYLVINISSPNTPGLRDLQHVKQFESLLDDVLRKMDELGIKKPLLVKLAPDLTSNQLKELAHVIEEKKCGQSKVSGVILTNTTISRPSYIVDESVHELGGLSGEPLRDSSTSMIRDFYQLTKGRVPIIGVGGVSSGRDAYEKIKAGASLIQLYTGLVYEGPPIVNKIKRELVDLLEQNNHDSISQIVGLDHRSGK